METASLSPQEYQYLPKVKKFYYWALLILVLTELVVIRLNLGKFLEERWYVGLIHLLLASSVPLTILYRLLRHVHPLIHTRFRWENKGILLVHRKKERHIDFDQISRIKISRWPTWWGGGFSLHLKSGQVFHLLSFIDHGYEILEKLMKENPGLYVSGPVVGFIKRAPYVSATWKRWKLIRIWWHWFLLKHLTLPLIAALWLWQRNSPSEIPLEIWLISTFIGNVVISAFVYHLQEEWLLHKANQVHSPDQEFRAWVIGFQAFYFVLVLAALASLSSITF